MRRPSQPIIEPDVPPERIQAVLQGLGGLAQSVNRVLANVTGDDRDHVLRYVSELQRELLAIDNASIGSHLHALPLLPNALNTARMAEELQKTTKAVRKRFMRTCITMDSQWGGTLASLPPKDAQHALTPLEF